MAYLNAVEELSSIISVGIISAPIVYAPDTTTGVYLRSDGRLINGAGTSGTRMIAMVEDIVALGGDFIAL